jgi:hypothetical protein
VSLLPRTHSPPIDFGVAAAVAGTVALLVFFMPVLGIPIGAFGLLFGIIGVAGTVKTAGAHLRWALLGIAVSSLALAVNIAIAFAPSGYWPGREVPRLWQAVPDRPYVPPPAK